MSSIQSSRQSLFGNPSMKVRAPVQPQDKEPSLRIFSKLSGLNKNLPLRLC